MTTVVVTGVGRYLGARVATRLAADPRIDRVVGIDATPPAEPVTPDFIQVDLRTSEITQVIADAQADTVMHLAIATSPDANAGGRPAMKEQNVIGTMQLLAACQQVPTVRKVIVRSSTAAYGASFRDPAVFTEDTTPREVPRGGFARDILDIEGYVRGFRRRRPNVLATVLRFAPFVGSPVDTALTRYFLQPVVPTVFGRDPRLQFVHIDDAQEVLHRSVVEDHPGTFNVAGPGVIMLSQAVRRAGRIAVPVVEFGLSGVAAVAKSLGIRGLSLDQVDLFVHGRVVDTTELTQEYGFTPRSTTEAFCDFLRVHRLGAVLGRDRIAAAERSILDNIRRARASLGGCHGDE